MVLIIAWLKLEKCWFAQLGINNSNRFSLKQIKLKPDTGS